MTRIEHWSDYRCPFCYIGDALLEKTLKSLEPLTDVELTLRSYELDPDAKRSSGLTTAELLERKYGITPDDAKARITTIDEMARRAGLHGFSFGGMKATNTFDAHRLTKYATEKGHPEIYGALMHTAFIANLDVGNHDVLTEVAVSLGLNEAEVREVLAGERYADEVRADEYMAARLGIRSVPAYVVDGEKTFTGAGCMQDIKEYIENKRKAAEKAKDR